MREKLFWEQIDILALLKDQNASAYQLETLHDTIEGLFGDRAANEFVRLSAALKSSTLPAVARAVKDLEKHHWFHEDVIAHEKDRKVEKLSSPPRPRHGGFGFLYGYDDRYLSNSYKKSAQTRTSMVDRYIPAPHLRPLFEMDVGLKTFLADNFVYLAPEQKNVLRRLFSTEESENTPNAP